MPYLIEKEEYLYGNEKYSPDKGGMQIFWESRYWKHGTFHQDLGCAAKIPKCANVQCHKVCTSSVHSRLESG